MTVSEAQKWLESYSDRVCDPKNRSNSNLRNYYPSILSNYQRLVHLGYRVDNKQDYALFSVPDDYAEQIVCFVVDAQIKPEIAYVIKEYLNFDTISKDFWLRVPLFKEALQSVKPESVREYIDKGFPASYAVIIAYKPELEARFHTVMTRDISDLHLYHYQHKVIIDPACDLEVFYTIIEKNRWLMYDGKLHIALAKGYSVDEMLGFELSLLSYYSPEEIRRINVNRKQFNRVFKATYNKIKNRAASVEQVEKAVDVGMKNGTDFKRAAKAIKTSPLKPDTWDAVIDRWAQEPIRPVPRHR